MGQFESPRRRGQPARDPRRPADRRRSRGHPGRRLRPDASHRSAAPARASSRRTPGSSRATSSASTACAPILLNSAATAPTAARYEFTNAEDDSSPSAHPEVTSSTCASTGVVGDGVHEDLDLVNYHRTDVDLTVEDRDRVGLRGSLRRQVRHQRPDAVPAELAGPATASTPEYRNGNFSSRPTDPDRIVHDSARVRGRPSVVSRPPRSPGRRGTPACIGCHSSTTTIRRAQHTTATNLSQGGPHTGRDSAPGAATCTQFRTSDEVGQRCGRSSHGRSRQSEDPRLTAPTAHREDPATWMIAAGVPWFVTLFGRDSLSRRPADARIVAAIRTSEHFALSPSSKAPQPTTGEIFNRARSSTRSATASSPRCDLTSPAAVLRLARRDDAVRPRRGPLVPLARRPAGRSTRCGRTSNARWSGSTATETSTATGCRSTRPAPPKGCTTKAGRTPAKRSFTPTARTPRFRSPPANCRATSSQPNERGPTSSTTSTESASRAAQLRDAASRLVDELETRFWWEAEGHVLPRSRRQETTDRVGDVEPRPPSLVTRGRARSVPLASRRGSWRPTCGADGACEPCRQTTPPTTRSRTSAVRSGRTTTPSSSKGCVDYGRLRSGRDRREGHLRRRQLLPAPPTPRVVLRTRPRTRRVSLRSTSAPTCLRRGRRAHQSRCSRRSSEPNPTPQPTAFDSTRTSLNGFRPCTSPISASAKRLWTSRLAEADDEHTESTVAPKDTPAFNVDWSPESRCGRTASRTVPD